MKTNTLLGTKVTCSKCGKEETCHWDHTTNDNLHQHKLCFTCNFWREKAEPAIKNHKRTARTLSRGKIWHYHVNDMSTERNRSFLGHGGAHFTFVFDDGRVLNSNDVWSQGDVPAQYAEELPVNAFVSEIPLPDQQVNIPDGDPNLATVQTTRTCPFCHTEQSITIPLPGLKAWSQGTPIQRAFPKLTNDEREAIKTGMCPRCWPEETADLQDDPAIRRGTFGK